MKKIILTFTLVLLLLTSCSDNKPSENQVKEDLSEIITTGTSNSVVLENFEKTDGLSKKENDISMYIMFFKGKVKFVKEVYSKITIPTSTITGKAGFLDVKETAPIDSRIYTLIKENEIYEIKGKMEYLRTEKEWKINNFTIEPITNK
ncbi:MAG: hypothetical protein Q3983_09935 [Capnocytophaga sp.]|nr:hypothetical protein [Capnocytophaga sp.]